MPCLPQAFGVGALEDDDDMDIYAMDHMSNYDTELPSLREDVSRSSGHGGDRRKVKAAHQGGFW